MPQQEWKPQILSICLALCSNPPFSLQEGGGFSGTRFSIHQPVWLSPWTLPKSFLSLSESSSQTSSQRAGEQRSGRHTHQVFFFFLLLMLTLTPSSEVTLVSSSNSAPGDCLQPPQRQVRGMGLRIVHVIPAVASALPVKLPEGTERV